MRIINLTRKTRAEQAETLLGLLSEHVDAADEWEDYYTSAIGGEIKGEEERREYKRVQEEFARPLIARCLGEGFKYNALANMIPKAFKTSHDERHTLLSAIQAHAEEKYGFTAPC